MAINLSVIGALSFLAFLSAMRHLKLKRKYILNNRRTDTRAFRKAQLYLTMKKKTVRSQGQDDFMKFDLKELELNYKKSESKRINDPVLTNYNNRAPNSS